MKPFFLLWLCCVGTVCGGQIPVQLFAAHRGVEYNFFWFKNIGQQQKVTLFNFTYVYVDYRNRADNVAEVFQVATFNFNKSWGLSGGGSYAGGGFVPQVALSYQRSRGAWYINFFPSVQYNTSDRWLEYGLFGLLFYQPPINPTWKGFGQLAFEPSFNKRGHLFSYQQLRVGLNYKQLFQFGIGANLEQDGPRFSWRHNYGIFVRKEL